MRVASFFAAVALMAGIGLQADRTEAAVLLDTDFSGVGQMATPGSFSTSFSGAAAGSGSITFELAGYLSLDGFGNCCTDTFSLSVNGTPVFSGSFNMGGGGTNVILLAPFGATASTTTFGFFAGGETEIFVPITLQSGVNTLLFSYAGAAQGLGDEAWGLNRVLVEGSLAAVPLPAALPLFASALGAASLFGYRRKRKAALAAA